MTHLLLRILVLAAAFLVALAGQASAQDVQIRSRSLVPAAFPRWDAGGSVGFLSASAADTFDSWSGWEAKADYRFDLGRYWTPHLKTEVAFTASNSWSDYESEILTVPVVPRVYAYNIIDRRLYSVAPAVTWQFRENSFMHPYVTGGVKLGFLNEHRYRNSDTYRVGTVSYPVPPLDESRTVVLTRPFAAGGFKSYISRRVYTRTEGRVAFARDGARQFSLGLGVGVDF